MERPKEVINKTTKNLFGQLTSMKHPEIKPGINLNENNL